MIMSKYRWRYRISVLPAHRVVPGSEGKQQFGWQEVGNEKAISLVAAMLRGKTNVSFSFVRFGSCSARARTGAVMFEIW